MAEKEKDMDLKSSTDGLQVCQLKKQKSERVLNMLQRIVVSMETKLWRWEMAEEEYRKKEITWKNSPIIMLCSLKIWINFQI